MGLLKQSARKWEKEFRSQVEPQVRAGSTQVVAQLRDKSRGAAHGHMPDAVRIMAEYGYRLAQSDLQPLPGGLGIAAGWGTLTFERDQR